MHKVYTLRLIYKYSQRYSLKKLETCNHGLYLIPSKNGYKIVHMPVKEMSLIEIKMLINIMRNKILRTKYALGTEVCIN